MLRQEVVVAALAETAFIEYPPKLLTNFIRRVYKRDTFIRFTSNKDYTLNN